MGLFGGKDDTRQKIEELKMKMQHGQPPAQQAYPPHPAAPPAQEPTWQQPQQPVMHHAPQRPVPRQEPFEELSTGIVLDLGDGMSLNLPVKSHMRLDEFLKLADRVRELKRIEHPQNY